MTKRKKKKAKTPPKPKPKKRKKPQRDAFGRFLPKKGPTPRPELASPPRRGPDGRFLKKPEEKPVPTVPVKPPTTRQAVAAGTGIKDDLDPVLIQIARDLDASKAIHLYDTGEITGAVYMRNLADEPVLDLQTFIDVLSEALAACSDSLNTHVPPLAFYPDLGLKMILSFIKDEKAPMLEDFDNLDDEHDERHKDGLVITGSDLDRSRRGAGGEIYVDAETGHFFGDVQAPVNVLRTEVLGRLVDYIERTFDLDACAEQGTFPYQPYSVQMLFTWSPFGQRMLRRGPRTWS